MEPTPVTRGSGTSAPVALVAVMLLGVLLVFPPVLPSDGRVTTRRRASPPARETTGGIVDLPFVQGSSFVVHVPMTDESCRDANAPPVDPAFYAALPSFQRMRRHAAAVVSEAALVASGRAPLSRMVELLSRMRSSVVRNNSNDAATSHQLSAQARKLVRCAAKFADVGRSSNDPPPFSRGLREACGGSDFEAALHDMLHFLENGTRSHSPGTGVTFHPTHFVDFGARMYSAGGRMRGAGDTYESSVRWMEAHYPRFAQLSIDVFEVDAAAYADTYASVASRRSRSGSPPLRFFPAAIWVHDEGLSMPTSAMMSADLGGGCVAGEPGGRPGCQCLPTVDIASYLRPFPRGSVVVKMDVEGAEWQLFQRLLTTGTLNRIGELFLECHSLDFDQASMFAAELGNVTKGTLQRELIFRASDGGFDCNALHDALRRLGVHTAPWP